MSDEIRDCLREQVTLHHRGSEAGYGPVRHPELVVMAVFAQTPRGATQDTLGEKSFPSSQLKDAEMSLARRAYISKEDFFQFVVLPQEPRQGTLAGVVHAVAARLRELPYTVVGPQPPLVGRAVCVLDVVSEGDHDSHAVLAYSEAHEALTAKQKAKIRPLIQADLASVFGRIVSLDDVWGA